MKRFTVPLSCTDPGQVIMCLMLCNLVPAAGKVTVGLAESNDYRYQVND